MCTFGWKIPFIRSVKLDAHLCTEIRSRTRNYHIVKVLRGCRTRIRQRTHNMLQKEKKNPHMQPVLNWNFSQTNFSSLVFPTRQHSDVIFYRIRLRMLIAKFFIRRWLDVGMIRLWTRCEYRVWVRLAGLVDETNLAKGLNSLPRIHYYCVYSTWD